MDIVKAAVRHDQDDILCLRITAEMVHDLFSSRVKPGVNPLRPQRLDQRLRCKARLGWQLFSVVVDIGDEHTIGDAERLGILVLKHGTPARGGTGLEDSPQPCPRIGLTYALQGDAHCCWMMREIVENRDAADHATYFAAPFDVRIGGQAGSDLRRRQAQALGDNHRRQHILHVVRSEQRTGERPERLAVMVHSEVRARGIGMPGDHLPLGAGFQTIGLDRRGNGYGGQQLTDMGSIVASDETAIGLVKVG